MSPRLDRTLNRIWLTLLGLAGLVAALAMGTLGGTLTAQYHWPYTALSRDLMTPSVRPGGKALIRKVIEYHDDCDLRSDIRLQSLLPEGRRVVYDRVELDRTPFYLSGKPQTMEYEVPADFPCGPAMIVESPSAACTWIQRNVRRQKAQDVFTHFEVGCSAPG